MLYILGNAFQGRDLKGEGFHWPVPGFWFKYIRERTDEWISVRGRSSLCNPSFPPPFFPLAWSQPLFFVWSLFSFSKHWMTIKPSVFFTRLFTFFHWVLVILLDFQILMCRKGKGKLHLACLNFYYNSLKLLLKWTAIKTCYNFGKLCLFLSFFLALAALEMCCLVVC